MGIVEATERYERWLAAHVRIDPAGLKRKHHRMASGAFPFLRATFFRWAQLWAREAPDESSAPHVISVGDLHIENFGTWRDADGRLAWGINDFDEAHPLPWTHDLARLATSALLAIDDGHLQVEPREACAAIVHGYAAGLSSGGRPLVLAEGNAWLRGLAARQARDAARYWRKLSSLPNASPAQARAVVAVLGEALPAGAQDMRVATRRAGLGSLGRPRYVAIATWAGGMVAREAKPVVPSAVVWASGHSRGRTYAKHLVAHAVRAADPTLQVAGAWIVRRLAADCQKIDLARLPRRRDEYRLLTAMGFETANVHLASASAVRRALGDLEERKSAWLWKLAKRMAANARHDWKSWKRELRAQS